jgi:hypothetical protein
MEDLLRKQVLIPESLWRKVQSAARTSHRTASAVVREALKEYLDQHETEPPPIPSFPIGAPDEIARGDYYDDRC